MQIGQFQLQIRGKNHSKDSQTLWQGFRGAQESPHLGIFKAQLDMALI